MGKVTHRDSSDARDMRIATFIFVAIGLIARAAHAMPTSKPEGALEKSNGDIVNATLSLRLENDKEVQKAGTGSTCTGLHDTWSPQRKQYLGGPTEVCAEWLSTKQGWGALARHGSLREACSSDWGPGPKACALSCCHKLADPALDAPPGLCPSRWTAIPKDQVASQCATAKNGGAQWCAGLDDGQFCCKAPSNYWGSCGACTNLNGYDIHSKIEWGLNCMVSFDIY